MSSELHCCEEFATWAAWYDRGEKPWHNDDCPGYAPHLWWAVPQENLLIALSATSADVASIEVRNDALDGPVSLVWEASYGDAYLFVRGLLSQFRGLGRRVEVLTSVAL